MRPSKLSRVEINVGTALGKSPNAKLSSPRGIWKIWSPLIPGIIALRNKKDRQSIRKEDYDVLELACIKTLQFIKQAKYNPSYPRRFFNEAK